MLTSIWRFHPEQANSHPAPFPIALPARAFYSVMDDNKGCVIDPYCGSGTTLVAAKLLEHDFIGIDISPEYVDHARIRLRDCERERRALLEELEKHRASKTFSERKQNGGYTGRFRQSKGNSTTEQIPFQLFKS